MDKLKACSRPSASSQNDSTSRTSIINHMLLSAWRERWSDAQFGIKIKKLLPRGVSGDAYNLADCILQQALVGSDANKLVMSYLRHSLCSHLISHGAVLRRIVKYKRFENTFTVIALLDFLEAMLGGITCRNKPEESIIGNAVLSLVFWLAEAYKKCLDQNRVNNEMTAEQNEMAVRCTAVLSLITQHQFMRAILLIAAQEDAALFADIRNAYVQIKNDTLNSGFQPDTSTVNTAASTAAATTAKPFDEHLKTIINHTVAQMPVMCASSNKYYESISYCLQPLLAVKVLQNPNTDTRTYVSDLQMIRRIKNYTLHRLYYEIFRSCLMSLYVSSAARESIWCAFTFIMVPQVIGEISFAGRKRAGAATAATAATTEQTSAAAAPSAAAAAKLGYCPDVLAAFELLIQDPILDYVDTKCACNTVEYLLTELAKHGLVTEEHVKRFSEQRQTVNAALAKIDHTNPTSIIRYVICAETPFTGILKALSADYNKMQEPLLGMFVQVLSGNSLELILSVASVEGKLRTFVTRLINCNEQSLYAESSDKDKAVAAKASLFDISFLMLTCIVQTYGSALVLENSRGTSFFERWVREAMIERNHHKSPTRLVQRHAHGAGDAQQRIDELLLCLSGKQPAAGGSATPSSSAAGDAANVPPSPGTAAGASAGASTASFANCAHIGWQDVCDSLPAVLNHILIAWENDVCSAADVKACLEAIKSRMGAFSVCAASWLNAYMLAARETELLKPLKMLQHLLLAPVGPPDDLTQKENFQERHLLAAQIISKMQHDAHPTRRLAQLPGAAVQAGGAANAASAAAGGGPNGSGGANAAGSSGANAGGGGPMTARTTTGHQVLTQNLTTVGPLVQPFNELWQSTVKRGFLPIDHIQTLEVLLQTSGPFWMVSRLIDEMLRCKFTKELLRMMDVAFALMHMQIEKCTVALLSEWLPMLLLNRLQNIELLAPHSSVLARLCVMCILATMDATAATADTKSPAGQKRRHSPSANNGDGNDNASGSPAAGDLDLDTVGPMLKARKLDGDLDPIGGDFVYDMAPPAATSTAQRPNSLEPLHAALVQLFRQFAHFVQIDQLSPKIYFISQFLTLLVQLGGDRVKPLLRLAPAGLMQNLLRVTVCDDYTAGFLLRAYDLGMPLGRRMAIADLSLWRNIQLRNGSIDL